MNQPLTHRGVCYDTGTNFETGQGELSRVVWSTERMREDIRAIGEDMHCNAVTVYGTDLGRLTDTATAAAERGLHVWLQPRLVDRSQDDILDHLAEAARLVQSLRRNGAQAGLNVGCEHIFFTPDIVPGDAYFERMANLHESAEAHPHARAERNLVDIEDAMKKLNLFLDRAVMVAKSNFDGKVTYGAAPFEDVDWSLFDLVGLNYYYSYHPTRQGYLAELGQFQRWGKPILICEFGTSTYAGAAERGGLAFNIVDRDKAQPEVYDGYVRDEQAQADHHLSMLSIFEELGAYGALVYEFIHPTHPHSPDPRFDLDTASMAIVKTIRDDYYDHASPYRWEPKRSFHALAEYNLAAKQG